MYKPKTAETPKWFFEEIDGSLFGVNAEKVKAMLGGRDMERKIWEDVIQSGIRKAVHRIWDVLFSNER